MHERATETHQRELEERQIELHNLDTFLELYARFSENDSLHGNEDITGTANQQPDAPEFFEEDSSGNGSISQEQFEADTRRILLEHGRPMKRGQIIKKFRSSGLRVSGTNEPKNFGTKIWRGRLVFINISGEGY